MRTEGRFEEEKRGCGRGGTDTGIVGRNVKLRSARVSDGVQSGYPAPLDALVVRKRD